MTRWPALRSRIDQFSGRLRQIGLRETLWIERDVVRRILKTTLAATLSWFAAELIGSPRPALASLAAIIVLQVTVRASLARSIQLTVGVTLGLIASIGIGHVLGVRWWTIAIIVLAGLIAGEVFRLGAMSGQVAISGMLALSLGSSYGLQRTIDTALGALIGVLVNVAVSPTSYVSDATRALRAIGEDLGALLDDMGSALGTSSSRDTYRRWLTRARDLSADSRAAIATVKQGEESLQFNPRARREIAQLERLAEARRALDHAINQTRGVARSLLELPEADSYPGTAEAVIAARDEVLAAVGLMMRAGGRGVAAFGRLQEKPNSVADRFLLTTMATETTRLSGEVVRALTELERCETGEHPADAVGQSGSVTRLLTSIFVDVERLVHEVDITEGDHRSAVAELS